MSRIRLKNHAYSGIYDISHLSYHVIPPVRPHELRRTSPGRLVALRRLVGPHLQGRLSTKALTRVRSCLRRCDLPPCAGGEAAELSGDPRQKTPSRVFPVTVVLCTTGDGRYSHQALQCQRAVVRSCENRRPVLFFENTAKGLTPKVLPNSFDVRQTYPLFVLRFSGWDVQTPVSPKAYTPPRPKATSSSIATSPSKLHPYPYQYDLTYNTARPTPMTTAPLRCSCTPSGLSPVSSTVRRLLLS